MRITAIIGTTWSQCNSQQNYQLYNTNTDSSERRNSNNKSTVRWALTVIITAVMTLQAKVKTQWDEMITQTTGPSMARISNSEKEVIMETLRSTTIHQPQLLQQFRIYILLIQYSALIAVPAFSQCSSLSLTIKKLKYANRGIINITQCQYTAIFLFFRILLTVLSKYRNNKFCDLWFFDRNLYVLMRWFENVTSEE
jgi:hypothetical protein